MYKEASCSKPVCISIEATIIAYVKCTYLNINWGIPCECVLGCEPNGKYTTGKELIHLH